MRVPFLPVTGCCRVCGRAATAAGDYLCEDCSGSGRPCFDRAASAVRLEGETRRMILDYKFNDRLHYRDDFTDWLEAALSARFEVAAIDTVTAMPLTFRRRFIRGYNQAAILAEALARRIDRRCDSRLLGRVGSPLRQSDLAEEERRENVRDTVTVRRPAFARGRTVLVVDDIMTTGATLSECARALKAAGAARVWCLSLARSIRS